MESEAMIFIEVRILHSCGGKITKSLCLKSATKSEVYSG